MRPSLYWLPQWWNILIIGWSKNFIPSSFPFFPLTTVTIEKFICCLVPGLEPEGESVQSKPRPAKQKKWSTPENSFFIRMELSEMKSSKDEELKLWYWYAIPSFVFTAEKNWPAPYFHYFPYLHSLHHAQWRTTWCLQLIAFLKSLQCVAGSFLSLGGGRVWRGPQSDIPDIAFSEFHSRDCLYLDYDRFRWNRWAFLGLIFIYTSSFLREGLALYFLDDRERQFHGWRR